MLDTTDPNKWHHPQIWLIDLVTSTRKMIKMDNYKGYICKQEYLFFWHGYISYLGHTMVSTTKKWFLLQFYKFLPWKVVISMANLFISKLVCMSENWQCHQQWFYLCISNWQCHQQSFYLCCHSCSCLIDDWNKLRNKNTMVLVSIQLLSILYCRTRLKKFN